MNCHSFKKDMTILGTAYFSAFLRVTLRFTLQTYRELLELVSRDQ